MTYQTIYEELEYRGIKAQDFDKFYQTLKENKKLPPKDLLPSEQYQQIVVYLQQKNVLGKNKVIKKEGIKTFDNKKQLEELLKETNQDQEPIFESSGGIMPCRNENQYRSGGGMAPCRH